MYTEYGSEPYPSLFNKSDHFKIAMEIDQVVFVKILCICCVGVVVMAMVGQKTCGRGSMGDS